MQANNFVFDFSIPELRNNILKKTGLVVFDILHLNVHKQTNENISNHIMILWHKYEVGKKLADKKTTYSI